VLRRRDRVAISPTTVLPGYADLTEIGSGAFATVYGATELETGRDVALKILKLDAVHPNLIRAFNDEIRAFGKVSDHPNIVTLYRSLMTPDGRPALVLELCRESFSQRLRRSGPLDAREAVRVGIKIASALEAAHRTGLLHRDLKPQNILVTQFDEPVLADFGLAAWQPSARDAAGVFGFTTVHAAPEILEGRHLSPATDVYGLASTMYQLLTDQAPFTTYDNEAPAAVILRILRDPVRPVRSDSVPLDLSDLLEAALAKQPGRRPQSAAQFAEALTTIEASYWWPQTSPSPWGEGPARREPTGLQAGLRAPRSLLAPLLPPLLPSIASDPLAGPPASSGPSVHTPERSPRNVVAPGGTARGQPSGPLDVGGGRLPPLMVEDGSAHRGADDRVTRPLFVDPEDRAAVSTSAKDGPLPGRPERRPTDGPAAASSPLRPTDRSFHGVPPAAIAGVALAVLVVIAAVLLVVGAL